MAFLKNLFGSNSQAQGLLGSSQYGQLANAAQGMLGGNQYSAAGNATIASAQAALQYQQLMQQQYAAAFSANQHKFMLDGRTMTFEEFLDEVAPDDGAMRTFLTLKYKKD